MPSPFAQAPSDHSSESGGAPSAMPASRRAFARIFSVALLIAAGAPGDGDVLKPCPLPKRSVSAGLTFTSSAGTPSSSATSCAYSCSLPSGSVVRLSTIFPVGWTRRKTARYASFATGRLLSLLVVGRRGLAGEAQALLVRRQRVVVLAVAERRLRSAERVRRGRRALATGVDAGLRGRCL